MWNVDEAIQRTGILQNGHFLLSSGLHSEQYLQCALMLQYPDEAEGAGQALASHFSDQKIDIVVGPALGGVVIAHEVARALQVPCLFLERKQGKMELRRGFSIEPGQRVLVVEDVVTTGGSVKEVIQQLRERDADLVGVGSIVDRTGGHSPFDVPYRSLTTISIESYEPGRCPLCQQGLPVVKPGSRTEAT